VDKQVARIDWYDKKHELESRQHAGYGVSVQTVLKILCRACHMIYHAALNLVVTERRVMIKGASVNGWKYHKK
jgi:hypothetical protein